MKEWMTSTAMSRKLDEEQQHLHLQEQLMATNILSTHDCRGRMVDNTPSPMIPKAFIEPGLAVVRVVKRTHGAIEIGTTLVADTNGHHKAPPSATERNAIIENQFRTRPTPGLSRRRNVSLCTGNPNDRLRTCNCVNAEWLCPRWVWLVRRD